MRHFSIKEVTCRYLFNAISFANLNSIIRESLKFQAVNSVYMKWDMGQAFCDTIKPVPFKDNITEGEH